MDGLYYEKCGWLVCAVLFSNGLFLQFLPPGQAEMAALLVACDFATLCSVIRYHNIGVGRATLACKERKLLCRWIKSISDLDSVNELKIMHIKAHVANVSNDLVESWAKSDSFLALLLPVFLKGSLAGLL